MAGLAEDLRDLQPDDPVSGPPIGARIARQRRRRGLSQAELAGLCGVSTSWLSQVERGRRGVPKYETLVQLAEVLHCGISDLTGAAEPDRDVRGFTPASAVRRTLDAHDLVPLLLSGDEQQPVAEPWLRSRLARVQALYQAARYEEAGDLLPGVLASARLLVHQMPIRNRRRAYALLSEAYIAVVTVMNRVGERETARLAADRAIIAAEAADDPLSLTLATYRLGHVRLSAGAHDEAARLTSSTAAAIAGRAAASPQWLSLLGSASPDSRPGQRT
jgi:transcriptional regulator with XRE-family HTH domain